MGVDLSRLHGVLRDKTRARILELLNQNQSLSYTELQHLLGIEHTGKLNYHLKVLGDLISKDEVTGRYSLGEKGRAAVALIGKFEGGPRQPNGVSVLGAMLVLVGFYALYSSFPGLSLFAAHTNFLFSPLGIYLDGSLVLYLLFIASGAGLLYSRGWAWPSAVASLVLAVLLAVYFDSLFLYSVFFVNFGTLPLPKPSVSDDLLHFANLLYFNVPTFVLAGIAIFYMTRPRIKTYFGRGAAIKV